MLDTQPTLTLVVWRNREQVHKLESVPWCAVTLHGHEHSPFSFNHVRICSAHTGDMGAGTSTERERERERETDRQTERQTERDRGRGK